MRALAVSLLLCLGIAVSAAAAAPPTTHEVIYTKPSGFWTSNKPATGGSYRWRLLGVGGVMLGLTGIIMLRLVRRANADRAARAPR